MNKEKTKIPMAVNGGVFGLLQYQLVMEEPVMRVEKVNGMKNPMGVMPVPNVVVLGNYFNKKMNTNKNKRKPIQFGKVMMK
tara:strand:- start:129 stop:371 length:243 start_codon:yes stop_codon:yes gene_type:complete